MHSAAIMQAEFDDFPRAAVVEHEEGPITLYLRLSREHGGLIPRSMLSAALGVSSTRVGQFIEERRFEVHEIGGKFYVTGDSFERFLHQERKNGRPVLQPAIGSLVKAALGR